MNSEQLRPCTVALVKRLLVPLMTYGVVTNKELQLITENLAHLAKHGTPQPAIPPKLITGQEAADLMSISYSQFREMERNHEFPFKRRSVGKRTVRFLNTDVIKFIEYTSIVQPDSLNEEQESSQEKGNTPHATA